MGWYQESLEAMARALCAVFGIAWDSDRALDFIRYAYRREGASPMPEYTRDVVYITMQEVDDAPTAWASTSMANGTVTVEKTIPLSCLLSFYGENSMELAEKAWSGLVLDTGPDSPRAVLRRFGIVPVTRPDRPVSMNEQVAGLWRMRSDVRARLNMLFHDSYSYDPLTGVPELGIAEQR